MRILIKLIKIKDKEKNIVSSQTRGKEGVSYTRETRIRMTTNFSLEVRRQKNDIFKVLGNRRKWRP